MAHNRQEFKPNHHPPSSSSEEEEEEDIEEEEEEEASGSEEDEQTSCSESDSEPPKKTLIPPPQSSTKKPPPQQQQPDFSSNSDSDSDDTDSDSPPKKPQIDPNIKPISSKPMEQQQREDGPIPSKKSGSGSGSKPSSTPSPAKAGGKRPPPSPAVVVEKDSKKAKKNTVEEDSKKQLFQRLWSEDDEIVILKGMIDYKTEKNGENPVADMGAFHEFIKKNLHVDVSRAQLVDKVRRLKKKYVNNASREKNGKDRSFSKSHEQKGYELSKLIWGSNGHNTESKKSQNYNNNPNSNSVKGNNNVSGGGGLMKANGVETEKEVLGMEVDKSMDVSRFVRYGRDGDSPIVQEEIVKAGLELVEGSKREELEEKWKKLKKQELQLYVMRLELLKEQSALVYEAVNSSGN